MSRSEQQICERLRRLDRVASFLRRKPRTAMDVAREFGCTKAAAYKWIDEVAARGYRVQVDLQRLAKSGPMTHVYSIEKGGRK